MACKSAFLPEKGGEEMGAGDMFFPGRSKHAIMASETGLDTTVCPGRSDPPEEIFNIFA